jgi:hypothetical protein
MKTLRGQKCVVALMLDAPVKAWPSLLPSWWWKAAVRQ